MSDDQFTKLFIYLEEFRSEVNHKLDQKADRGHLETIYNMLDDCIKRLETEEHEKVFTNHQIDRHEGWIKQLSRSTKTKLIPEP